MQRGIRIVGKHYVRRSCNRIQERELSRAELDGVAANVGNWPLHR